jgi:uncharacterized protein (DUF2235 family)
MAKRIIVCCDGTWDGDNVAGDGTNVRRFCKLLAPQDGAGARQLARYHNGVGAADRGWDRIKAGMTGAGLDRILLAAYRDLVADYEPGDRLHLVGFSRGAFTARSLAGLIRNSGIVKRQSDAVAAFELYRSRRQEDAPGAEKARRFRLDNSWADITPIEFIGVWDTVGSLGVPLLRFGLSRAKFHDTDLSRYVRHACHAIAIDERRRFFKPTLWTQTAEGAGSGQRLVQRWFPGVHRDVGGGEMERGLSDVTLDWMIGEAKLSGLAFQTGASAPVAVRPDPLAPMNRSLTLFYRTFIPIHRRIDDLDHLREVRKTAAQRNPPVLVVGTSEELSPTACTRRKMTEYRSVPLEDYLRRNPNAC